MVPLGRSWGVWTVWGPVDKVLVGPEERTAEGPDAAGRGNSRQSGALDSGNRQ